jgi:hypothetical protein
VGHHVLAHLLATSCEAARGSLQLRVITVAGVMDVVKVYLLRKDLPPLGPANNAPSGA